MDWSYLLFGKEKVKHSSKDITERIETFEAVLSDVLVMLDDLQKRVENLEGNKYQTKRFFNLSEAADYLCISTSTLYGLTASKKIPHFKPFGKLLYFSKAELDQWMQRMNDVCMDENEKSINV